MLAGQAGRGRSAARRRSTTPKVYAEFLDFLVSQEGDGGRGQSLDASWRNCASPFRHPLAFLYIRYLVGQHEVDQARLVWQQAATLCGLSAYQPSPENLIVNGDFSLNVLNGGFDWQYHQSKEVSLALDPTQSHGGHRSLLITFDARKIDDAGIGQLVPVKPSTRYDFSAYSKPTTYRAPVVRASPFRTSTPRPLTSPAMN